MKDNIQRLSEIVRECLQTLRPLHTSAEFDDKIALSEVLDKLIEAQGLIIGIQTTQQDVGNINERNELDPAEEQGWGEVSSKYKPFRLSSGCTVMVSREGGQSNYEKEWYCKHCFDSKKQSLLQPELRSIQFNCPTCTNKIWMDEKDETLFADANRRPPPFPDPGIMMG